jgi:uncharacterized repeat protein (TIGR03809 family)
MSERQEGPYDSIARRWLAIVERRQEHLVELCDSGRWRHYYTRAGFLDEMRKVLRVRDQWAAIAGVPLVNGDLGPDDGHRMPQPRELPAGIPAAPRPG